MMGFLLIVRTRELSRVSSVFLITDYRLLITDLVSRDTRMFQHTARFWSRNYNGIHSYGRRLPGLRFRASPSKLN
jgi:hypothetical protein